MTAAPHVHSEDGSFVIQSRREPGAPGGGTTYAIITCRSCGATDETRLKDKNAGWARRIFKSRGWTVADRPGRHQCPACVSGPRGFAGKSVREVKVFTRKEPLTASRHNLMGGSSLHDGSLNIAMVPADNVNGPEHVEDIDPNLLEPDRMAEALSHLGHVKKHVEAPPVVAKTPPSERRRRGHGPAQVKWRGVGISGALPISPKPLDLPDFVVPTRPDVRKYKRKLRGYRYPSDAAVVARAFCQACGIADPQIGQDFIVWAEGGEIGWAPITAPASQPAEQIGRLTGDEMLTVDPTPLTVEPVTPTPEEPMPSPVTLTPIPPPRPTREKLLAIHEKLNVVYITDGVGRYTGLWTDAKVAAELDVPTAWVVEERSRVYGEGTDNESSNIALDKWRRDMTNRMAKATERQVKAIEELLAVNTEIEAIKAAMSAGPKEGV